jgi:CubicO group peptidase (beta-lactamase class C family)
LGQLYLDGGKSKGKQIVPAAWVESSISAHARPNDDMDYGYLFWLMRFPGKDGAVWKSYSMNGTGGNSVQIFPEQRVVVVITTTNYNVSQPHMLTAKLLMEQILTKF